MVAAEQQWALVPHQREEMVERVANNLCAISFFSAGFSIDNATAHEAASTFERRAHAAAQVSSRTTTGARPLSESTQAYNRLVLKPCFFIVI